MEQESHHKRDAEETTTTEFQAPAIPTLCANNCGFFGSSATNNLCSKCYRDHFLSKSKVEAVVAAVEAAKAVDEGKVKGGVDAAEVGVEVGNASEGAPPKKLANRCGACNKKVGLMGFKCRCEEVFCSLHRYSDKHGCPFDYKSAGQEAIAKANPVVKADKVDKI